ncbi:hypothetical protein [Vampirovibrio chlorellavorus]|uniref:hypothetical protein n=1 Tax=Vampirovibrio chlorellavorus TaxID=758823 RepID=UPI0026EB5370|nr:hypothetical protein [Vampirovibrio chlorellavorus]
MKTNALGVIGASKGLIVLGAMLLSVTSPLSGWAKPQASPQPETQPRTQLSNPQRPQTFWPQLGGVQSLDVLGWETAGFSARRESVPPEIAEYARAALQEQSNLPYQSPADAILKFECADSGCYRVRAQVSQGTDGPVLWEHSEVYRRCPLMRFTFQPDGKKFARRMVNRLTLDYQNALKPNMAKIEIENP